VGVELGGEGECGVGWKTSPFGLFIIITTIIIAILLYYYISLGHTITSNVLSSLGLFELPLTGSHSKTKKFMTFLNIRTLSGRAYTKFKRSTYS